MRLVKILLHGNLIHFIGSDAHQASRSEFSYTDALCRVKKIVGDKMFHEVMVSNPQRIKVY